MVDTQDYENFFTIVKKFQEEQKKQKQRGLNDYNMVNVVRKENAEVGMHSNVIYSLINPNGLHYQDDLFLKLFIQEVLKINDFSEVISVNAEELTFENRRIDFTIKSSNYYVGIEMKIDASDLENQLSHYNEDLLKKAKDDNIENVIIYYLTKDGKEAAGHSSNEIEYKKISFKEDILNWIEKCQAEVRNITNLNEAFENYKDIVKKITNQYKGNIVTLDEYLNEKCTKVDLPEVYKILDDIEGMQKSIVEGFLKKIESHLQGLTCEKGKDFVEISIKNFVIRYYQNNINLLLQIGSKQDKFNRPVDKNIKEKVVKELKKVNKDFFIRWDYAYCELKMGEIKFQTQEKLLQDIVNYTKDIKHILEIIYHDPL